MQGLLLRYQKPLQEAGKQVASSPATTEPPHGVDEPGEGERRTSTPTKAQQERQIRRQNRKARYDQVVELHRQGVSHLQIACNLKMHRRTVRQFVQASEFPERASPRPRPGQHHPVDAYLHQRWEAGCHNAAQLFRELQERGFEGCQSALRRYLLAWRRPLPEGLQDRRGRKGEPTPPVCFSPRTTVLLLLGYAKSRAPISRA